MRSIEKDCHHPGLFYLDDFTPEHLRRKKTMLETQPVKENIHDSLCSLIGNTPLVRLSRFAPGVEIIAKVEAFNPGSSVKDRIGLAMIESAERAGLLTKGNVIIEPTSGNTGIGLALVAAIRGYRCILVMPESMSVERRKLLQGFGAELVLTPAKEGMEGAVRQAELLCGQVPGGFMPQQFSNRANPEIHYRTTGPEIWRDTGGKVAIFVAAVGTGGTVSGTGRFLKEMDPGIRVVAVEPQESPVLSGGKSGPHMIQGIGAGFVPENVDRAVIDEVVTVTSRQAIDTAKKIIRTEGLLVGISSGANAYAALWLAERPENKGKRIVTIMCDTGERYLSTLLYYDD
jgi:cysteine synthase A